MTDEEIAGLPPPEGHGPWSRLELRVASLEDAISFQTFVMASIANPDQKVVKFQPVARPGVVTKRRRKVDAEGLAYLQYLRDHQGALPPGYEARRAG